MTCGPPTAMTPHGFGALRHGTRSPWYFWVEARGSTRLQTPCRTADGEGPLPDGACADESRKVRLSQRTGPAVNVSRPALKYLYGGTDQCSVHALTSWRSS